MGHSSTPQGMGTNRYLNKPGFKPKGTYLDMKHPKGGSIKKKRLYKEINNFLNDPQVYKALNLGGEKKLPPPAIQK